MRRTEALRRSRRWDGEGCFAVDYLRSEGDAEPRRALVHAVKAGDPGALDHAASLMSAALAERERRLAGLNVGLVAIPGHLARRGTDVPEQLCRRICTRLAWVQHEPVALQRNVSVRRSRTAADRPSIWEHLASLALAHQPPTRNVILIDDVFTFGRVTEAASRLVRDAGATNVLVACLARTRL